MRYLFLPNNKEKEFLTLPLFRKITLFFPSLKVNPFASCGDVKWSLLFSLLSMKLLSKWS